MKSKIGCLLFVVLSFLSCAKTVAQNGGNSPVLIKKSSVSIFDSVPKSKASNNETNNHSEKARIRYEKEKAAKIADKKNGINKSNLVNTNFSIGALNNEEPKEHYIIRIKNTDTFKVESLKNAINNFSRLESFRLINQRRIITLADGLGEIELFSANELFRKYGRRVRPQNIKDGEKYFEIELQFSNENVIKERLKK